MPTLDEVLAARTREAAPELVESISGGRLRCYACGHQCPIPEGARGVCKVRYNAGGRLPFFHAYPGALAYSFGMLGCDLHCSYCQNWVTSQALRDPEAVASPQDTTPASLVQDALRRGDHVLLEGAQGTLLDLDHGTYPYVTSSNTIAGGACTARGLK